MNNSSTPAMPQPVTTNAAGDIMTVSEYFDHSAGLTKREHFAGLAMQGLLANQNSIVCQLGDITHDAVEAANSLLKALEDK